MGLKNKKTKQKIRRIMTVVISLGVLLGGVFWSINDSNMKQIIDGKVYYGILKFNTSFGVLFFWLTVTFILALAVLFVSKLVNNIIEKKYEERLGQENKEQITLNKENFERNVSACDYRKWSK